MRPLLHTPPEVGHGGALLVVHQVGEVGDEAAAGGLLVDELLLPQVEDLLGQWLQRVQRSKVEFWKRELK